MPGVVFRLPLRQTEGFVRSLVDLMGCDLPVPYHTMMSRRRRMVDAVVETSANKRPTDIVLDSTGLKFFGAGEWARARHGETPLHRIVLERTGKGIDLARGRAFHPKSLGPGPIHNTRHPFRTLSCNIEEPGRIKRERQRSP